MRLLLATLILTTTAAVGWADATKPRGFWPLQWLTEPVQGADQVTRKSSRLPNGPAALALPADLGAGEPPPRELRARVHVPGAPPLDIGTRLRTTHDRIPLLAVEVQRVAPPAQTAAPTLLDRVAPEPWRRNLALGVSSALSGEAPPLFNLRTWLEF